MEKHGASGRVGGEAHSVSGALLPTDEQLKTKVSFCTSDRRLLSCICPVSEIQTIRKPVLPNISPYQLL